MQTFKLVRVYLYVIGIGNEFLKDAQSPIKKKFNKLSFLKL